MWWELNYLRGSSLLRYEKNKLMLKYGFQREYDHTKKRENINETIEKNLLCRKISKYLCNIFEICGKEMISMRDISNDYLECDQFKRHIITTSSIIRHLFYTVVFENHFNTKNILLFMFTANWQALSVTYFSIIYMKIISMC